MVFALTYIVVGVGELYAVIPASRASSIARRMCSGSLTTFSYTHLERVFALIDEPPESEDAPDAAVLSDVKGSVEFEHVKFGYGEDEIIHDLSFSVKPGSTVAIAGPTGCLLYTSREIRLRSVSRILRQSSPILNRELRDRFVI